MEFTDPRTLQNKVLTIQQGRKRLQILIKMEQALDESGAVMTPRSTKELTCLNTIFESHGKKHLAGIVSVPRLISGAPYYSIKFSEQIVLPPPPQQRIVPYPKTVIDSWDAVHQACNQVEIMPEIKKIQDNLFQMDLETSSAELRHVGSLLAITIACSYGQNVSKPILKLSLDYHSLAHNSYSACHSFVKSCISALGFHKLALLSVYKKKYSILKNKMLQTGQLAHQMILECKKLIQSCSNMEIKMGQIIQQIIREDLKKNNQGKEMAQKYADHENFIQKSRKDLEFIQQEKAIQKTNYEKQLSSFQIRCQDIQEKLKTSFNTPQMTTNFPSFNTASGKTNIVPVVAATALGAAVGSVAGPIGTFVGCFLGAAFSLFQNGNSQKEAQRQKAKRVEAEITKMQMQCQEKRQANVRAHEIKLKLMQQAKVLFRQKCELEAVYFKKQRQIVEKEIKKNNDLITSVNKLFSTVKDNDHLQTAIVCLDIGKNILMKIQVSFKNVLTFWQGIKKGCQSSKDNIKDINDADIQITQREQLQLLNSIRKSGLDWLTLAKMNRSGAFMFKEIVKDIDDKMLSLPTQANAFKKIEELHNSLPKQLQVDNQKLQLKHRILEEQVVMTKPQLKQP